jgi:hypothetical protein
MLLTSWHVFGPFSAGSLPPYENWLYFAANLAPFSIRDNFDPESNVSEVND